MPKLTRRELLQASVAAGPVTGLVGAVAPAGAVAAAQTATTSSAIPSPRQRLLFDFGWRFHLGHAQDPRQDFNFGTHQRTYAKAGASGGDCARLDFDDSGWAAVDLPHDWAVALPFVQPANAPAAEDPGAAHGYKPLGRQYPATSVGWYRRVFDVPEADLGRRIVLEFEGVFRDAVVFCNGHAVARNESGYCGFSVDLTDVLDYGRRNLLAVRVDATLGEGWFYEGAGIYRHVWLVKHDALHVPEGGVYVRAEPRGATANVRISTEVRNDGTEPRACVVASTIHGPDGDKLARVEAPAVTVAPGETVSVEQSAELSNPKLWSVDQPHLHRLDTEILVQGAAHDALETPFGIRRFEFDAQRGFLLNGQPLKLQGTCNHQDHAGVGSAIPDGLHEWRIAQLKAMGSNAYRSAHNPASPALLDACDRLGMLVIDETRWMASSKEGLGQLERMVRRGRNHACVMLWSLGNEEPQMATERGARIVRSMKRLANRLDPSRLCTFAMDKGWGHGVFDVVDVVGFNYRINQMDELHARFPDKPLFGSETGSTVGTRGEYARDEAKGTVRAYDRDHPWWASTAEAWWSFIAQRPWAAGGFVWTGFDYRGEPTPYNRWPNVSSQFGIMDSCGFPKDNYWYYRAQWTREPVLHVFPHWNWTEGAAPDGLVDVWCHTNLERVELFVNGASQGAQDVPPYGHVEWRVKYAPGAIEARGYRGGALVSTSRRETAGAPAKIALRTDRRSLRADAEDLAIVAVEVTDAQGRVVPTAGHEVRFALTGPARLIGVGNGDPSSHESDRDPVRRAFNGACMAIVQATLEAGTIRIEASAQGLAGAMLDLEATAPGGRPFIP